MANTVPDQDRHRVVLSCFVYNDEGKFLITKRAPDHKAFPNKWAVPGGGLAAEDYINEPYTDGDHAWEGVLPKVLEREVKEEVGIDIDRAQYFSDFIFIRPDNVPVVVLRFAARYAGGEVVLEEGDATDYAWVTPEEAGEYELIGDLQKELRAAASLLSAHSYS